MWEALSNLRGPLLTLGGGLSSLQGLIANVPYMNSIMYIMEALFRLGEQVLSNLGPYLLFKWHIFKIFPQKNSNKMSS